MKKFRIRRANAGDIPQLMELDRAVWAEITDAEFLWTAKQFAHQLEVAGEYYYVAEIASSTSLCGYVTAIPMTIPVGELSSRMGTWEEMSSGGNYDRLDASGNCLYGVSLAVHPWYRQMGVADRLIEKEFSLAVSNGMEFGFLGGRLPGMAAYLEEHPDTTPEEYFQLRRPDGKAYDPELRLYERDFEVIRIIPEYFPDPESLDFGVLLLWMNPMPRWLPDGLNGFLFKVMLGAFGMYTKLRS